MPTVPTGSAVLRAGALALALALQACGSPATLAAASSGSDSGQVELALSGPSFATAGAAGATLTISPGGGPAFMPISSPLSQDRSGWRVHVSNIPAGARRRLEVVVYGPGGTPLFTGGVVADITSGSTSSVAMVVQQVGGGAVQLSNPFVSVGISVAAVLPGGTAQLTASATDPAGQPLALHWEASCGFFTDAGQPSTTWVAPGTPNQRCQLAFTAASPSASTTVSLPVDVLLDPSTRSVMGRRLLTSWEDPRPGSNLPVTSTREAPDVYTSPAPDALVETGPGTWQRFGGGHVAPDGNFYPSSFATDGSFYIPGLPQVGSYLLAFTGADGVPLLVATSSGDVDLGTDRIGRAGLAAGPGTTATFQLSQLDPWDTAWSELQLASSQLDVSASLALGAQLEAGATTAAVAVGWEAPLLFGDALWLSQLSPRLHPSGFLYRSTARAGQISPVTLLGGGSTTLAATLAQPAAIGTLDVQWAPGAFERSLGDMAPPARVAQGLVPPHRLSVKAFPVVSSMAPVPSAGALDLATLEAPAGTVAIGLASPLEYGRFLPSCWSEWREVRYAVAVGYQAPGGDLHYEVSSIDRREPVGGAMATILPTLTPVRAPLVNGSSALDDLAGPATTTPTFSWTPPATGTPSAYRLELFGLEVSPEGSTTARPVVRALTQATTFALPPDLLTAGGLYFARITALAGPHGYLASPLRVPRTEASATVLTGTFTP